VTTREVLEQMPLFGSRGAADAARAAVARLSALAGPAGWGGRKSPIAGAVGGGVPQVLTSAAAPRAASAGDRGLARFARAAAPSNGRGAGDDSGAPLLVIGEGALGGRVVAWAGPWRTVAEWWTDSPLALDAYDLELREDS